MPKKSAGILAYRFIDKQPEILLVHPGGPFFKNKDLGTWSLPKGEYDDTEDPFTVAKREFTEETGNVILSDSFLQLKPVKTKNGKLISIWAVEADFDQVFIESNLFELEWPPKSGKKQFFAEVDRAEWFSIADAKAKISASQLPFIDELVNLLG